jgi:hypothetical protein
MSYGFRDNYYRRYGSRIITPWIHLLESVNKKFWEELIGYFPCYDTGQIEHDSSNNYSITVCLFVTAVTFLPSRCLATIGGFFT